MEHSIERICEIMPKVELHAHLNGCITDDILLNLQRGTNLQGLDIDSSSHSITQNTGYLDTKLSLDDCWKAFARIHQVITTREILYSATCQVISNFARDRVVYLELRTTPKKVHEIDSKDIYIETVVNAIIDSKKNFTTIVKLLISVDRRHGEREGFENVQLSHKWSQMTRGRDVVVGIDISGDPTYGNIEWIGRIIMEAKRLKIPISCHLSEVGNVVETLQFLKLGPNRVAHGQFLHPSTGGTNELWETAKNSGIPIETCISSNIISSVSPSLEHHYVKNLVADGLSFVICTDDSGVFKTTLSKEYKIFLGMIPFSLEQLRMLCIQSITFAFTTEEEKIKIQSEMLEWWNNISKNKIM